MPDFPIGAFDEQGPLVAPEVGSPHLNDTGDHPLKGVLWNIKSREESENAGQRPDGCDSPFSEHGGLRGHQVDCECNVRERRAGPSASREDQLSDAGEAQDDFSLLDGALEGGEGAPDCETLFEGGDFI